MASIVLYDSPIIISGPENMPLNESEKRYKESSYLFRKGYFNYKKNNLDSAVNYFNRGIEINHNNSLCYYYRAKINIIRKKYKLAIRDLDKYCLQQQKSPKGYYLKYKIFITLFEETNNYKLLKLSELVLKQAIKNNINYKIFDLCIN